jgi:hypothetical protein
MTAHSFSFAQDKATGSLADMYANDADPFSVADFKRTLVHVVAREIRSDVPAPNAVTADLQYEYSSVDMNGRHRAVHSFRPTQDGGYVLLERRTYAKMGDHPMLDLQAGGSDGPVDQETDGAVEPRMTAETETHVDGDGNVASVEDRSTVVVEKGEHPSGDQPPANPNTEKTETIKDIGKTEIGIKIDVHLAGTKPSTKLIPTQAMAAAQVASFLQLRTGATLRSSVLPLTAPPRPFEKMPAAQFTAADLRAAVKLLTGGGDLPSRVLGLGRLMRLDGGYAAVVKNGLAAYAAEPNEDAFEALVAAIGHSGQEEAWATLAGIAERSDLPEESRRKALIAMLVRRRAPASALRQLERLALDDGSLADHGDVRQTALMVLGGLLHSYRGLGDKDAEAIVARIHALARDLTRKRDRLHYAAALGNAAFQSSDATLASLTADVHPHETRLGALRALSRVPEWTNAVTSALAAAANSNTTEVREAAQALLATRGVQVDLQVGGFVADHKVTFISASQELSKSDIHSVTVTEALVYSYGYEDGKSTNKLEGSATLNVKLYSAAWDFLSVGVYAKKETGEAAGVYFFVRIMGLEVVAKQVGKQNNARSMLLDLQELAANPVEDSCRTDDGAPTATTVAPEGDTVDKLVVPVNTGDATMPSAKDSAVLPPTALADVEEMLAAESKAADCEASAWGSSVITDFGYTKQLFEFNKDFWCYILWLNVKFWSVGKVGIRPGMSAATCTNAKTGGDEVVITGGLEPYASVTISLEVSINLCWVKAGVGGELKAIDVGFPIYGQVYTSSKSLCGHVDFRLEALSGSMYLFADSTWICCCGAKYKREGTLTLVSWTGIQKTWPLYNSCRGDASIQPDTPSEKPGNPAGINTLNGWCGHGGSYSSHGDFNGDGKADLFCDDSAGNHWVAISNGAGYSTNFYYKGGWCGHGGSYTRHADMNGDGKSDLLCDDSAGNHWVALSSGGGVDGGTHYLANWCGHGGSYSQHADRNGDGKADLFCDDSAGNHWVRYSSGTSTYDGGHYLGGWCGHSGSYSQHADRDGNGKSDLFCDDSAGNHWVKYEGTRDGGYYRGGWCGHGGSRSSHADMDGDRKSDLFCDDTAGRHWVLYEGSRDGGMYADNWCGSIAQHADQNGDGKADLLCDESNGAHYFMQS